MIRFAIAPGRSLVLSAATAAVTITLAVTTPALAQQFQPSPGDVNNRIDRLERDLQTLSRQVFRGEAPASTQGRQAGAVAPLPQGYATEFEIRLQGLESNMRTLTGEVERLRFELNQLNGRFDRALADVEFRLEQTSDGGASGINNQAASTGPDPRIVRPNTINNVGNAASAASAADGGQVANSAGTVAGGTVQTLGVLNADGSTSGALPADGTAGSLNAGISPGSNASQPLVTTDASGRPANPGGVVANTQTASATPVSVTLPEGDAQTQYDFAFGLLKQYQFEAAADALSQFLNNHPSDPLAANAQFWLGETHFVNGDYREAAVAFATGYEKFPQAEKGAENLLKLGMSLGRLGQDEEACLTLTRLGDEYPQAPGSVKQQAIAEQRDLGCGEG